MNFESANSANPFLTDDTFDCVPPMNVAASSNPFLNSDFVAESNGTDNPFLAESSFCAAHDLPGTNPFASYSNDYAEPSYEKGFSDSDQDYNNTSLEIAVDARPNELELHSSTSAGLRDTLFLLSPDEESSKPKRPQFPHPAMPKETQDLILSVTGALEATSHHLLDRLPPTRAPSPTAFPDFQSLSPNPDAFIDLLGTTPGEPLTCSSRSSDPGCEDLSELPKAVKAGPPPRPPPVRPAPPKSGPSKPQNDEADEFDLFGTSKPPPPKTKDAILNLYAHPKPPPKDLLTDDIDIPGSASNGLGENIDSASNKADMLYFNRDVENQEERHLKLSATEEKTLNHSEKTKPYNESDACAENIRREEIFEERCREGVTTESVEDGKSTKSAESSILSRTNTHQILGTKPFEVGSSEARKPVKMLGTEKQAFAASEELTFGLESSLAPRSAAEHNEPELDGSVDAFDAFEAKFESTGTGPGISSGLFDPFSSSGKNECNAWESGQVGDSCQVGFGTEDAFDAFLSMSQPPAAVTSSETHSVKTENEGAEQGSFNIFIRPREEESGQKVNGSMPLLIPPPKSQAENDTFDENSIGFNPFDRKDVLLAATGTERFQGPISKETEEGNFKRSESEETPPTPLFDDDVSQPLEDFPRIHYAGEGWEMQLRQPNKKKITGQRFWKKIFVKLVYQGDNPTLQLFNLREDKDPFQELPLQACYSVSDISAQQYDQFGKIFTVKLQYIFYKERPGVRPGQVTKAERITNKLSQFAAYAIQGDYQGVKEFGSDLRKLGLPVEHAPQISQLLKLGCMSYESLKEFSVTLEECLFRMPVHRDRALNYKMEEVQITVVDEIYVEQNAVGHVEKQIARVRLFFLGFLSGMPDVELGLNDIWRQGKEVVGRHDIIPVVTEEWIRLEAVEFHSCIQQEEYEKTRTIKFKPPDACYIELMRFRIRPPRNRELPLQLKAVMVVTGSKVELRADVLVPGFTSRKLGQIPCEDVMIRFPIPECWIYLFRVEKHFRYGSVKSAHRRTGKIKGIERFLGAVDTLEPSLMEVTSGQAKYEHQHRSIVWRMPRLPKEGQGAYTTHNLVCRMQLTSFDQIPDNLAEYAYVEFTMPATQASHTTVRSVSLCDSSSDNPPEKYVRQLARHEYRVGIEHVHSEETGAYEAATMVKPKVPQTTAEVPQPPPESDSDSSD